MLKMEKSIQTILRAEKKIIWALLLIVCCVLMYCAFQSEYCEGGADAIVHYGFAKYWIYQPALFLDLWAKPIFMLFSFPFAHFGFHSLKIFNIICALFSSYITYLIAQKLRLKYSWLVIIFIIFSPVYFIVSISTLTEILFSLILIYAVYLFLNNNYLLASCLISLLPFARQEGYGYVLLFGIALIINKKFKYLPYLFCGVFFFSLIGGFYFNDFLWLIHKHPYPLGSPYGKGELFHFINERDRIIGPILSILFLTGIIGWVYSFFFKPEKLFFEKSLFVFIGALFFLIVHSICWWKGLSGSLGLIRVMTCVIPLIALICLTGWNFFCSIVKLKLIIVPVLIFALFKIILSPFEYYKVPYTFNQPELVSRQTAEWIKANKMDQELICATDPTLWFFLNKNPFDHIGYREYFSPDGNDIRNKSIIVWDSEFGKHQQGLSVETFMENNRLKLLQVNTPFTSLGEPGVSTYAQYIFCKSDIPLASDNFKIEKNIIGFNITKMYKYSLKGFNQKYISCDLKLNDSLICNRDANYSWEEFGFAFEDDKRLRILCFNNNFITAANDSSGFYVQSNSPEIENGLSFELLKIDSNKISLRSLNNNFLTVDSASQKLMLFSGPERNSRQIFELIPVR